MSTNILRTADAWWVEGPAGAARITTGAATTGELLADRTAIAAAAAAAETESATGTPAGTVVRYAR